MPIEKNQGTIVLKHPKGSLVEILLYGATVVSWKAGSIRNPEPTERLFVSSTAALDGSKPVRGGIPVVFPCFGIPTHPEHMKLKAHGFARSELWKWDGVVMDNEAGVSVRLTLEPTPTITSLYARPFHLAYIVTLGEHQISTDLHVTNTSTSTASPPDPLEFQVLFHNYIRAPANEVLVTPLHNGVYYDKTEPTALGKNTPKIEARAAVDVKEFTDSVYADASQKYEVIWPGGGVEIKAIQCKDVEIWNPQEEAGSKMSDLEPRGWERFVCVEPGHVRGFAKVDPGHTWVGGQVISVIQD